MSTWTQQEAINLCVQIEALCPAYGCHVALTGGLLYKDGPRKDLDLLFYRVRQERAIDSLGLTDMLKSLGFALGPTTAWLWKATYQGKGVDIFFPEESCHNTQFYKPLPNATNATRYG